MSASSLVVDGVEVWVEGEGAHTVVMIHGWPDTHRLWNGQVAHLLAAFPGQMRCVRFTLPGFDLSQPARPMGLQGLVDLFARIVDTVSPGEPVTLMLHDWGCVFGYEYLAQHPQRVAQRLRHIARAVAEAEPQIELDPGMASPRQRQRERRL